MATFNGIAAVSSALLNVLKTSQPPSEFGAALEYKLFSAKSFENEELSSGYSLFLWRVTVSSASRNLLPRRSLNGETFRPSLPLDLHYLLTPWASDIETQQRMLGWAMRTFEDITTLPAAVLNYQLAETDTFSSSETIEMIADPLSLTDYFNLWDKLKQNLHFSMTYLVRNVLIDSTRLVQELPMVTQRVFDVREGAI